MSQTPQDPQPLEQTSDRKQYHAPDFPRLWHSAGADPVEFQLLPSIAITQPPSQVT